MLHKHLSLKWNSWLLIFLWLTAHFSCKEKDSTTSEDELAYWSDYESPGDFWGFVNQEGNLIIRAEYDDVGPFSEGLAAVNKAGKWGYIDKQGNTVIEPAYRSAWAFHEGYARVLPFDGPDHFVSRTGSIIKSENWAAADDFSNGRARVAVGNSFGFIDTSGQLIIQPLFTRGWNFGNGMCVVEYQEKLGVIDLKGNYLLQPVYDQIKKVNDNKILLCKKGQDAMAFDATGKELINVPNSKIIDSNEKMVSVRDGNKMYLRSLTDPSLRSDNFANIIYLEQDLWAGKTDSGYVLLNDEGKRISNNYYTQLNKFSEGFAAYSKDDYWGYIDTTGKELTGEVFGLAWDYHEGFARAAFKEGIAFIDKHQQLAFYPPRGTLDIRDFSEGLAAIQLD